MEARPCTDRHVPLPDQRRRLGGARPDDPGAHHRGAGELVQLKGLFVQIVDSGAGATLSTTSLEMVEDESVTHEVSLNTAPTANVVVTPATSSSANATVSGALTFTSTNYSAPQEVTVTGVADGTATISHTVTSTATTYNSLSVSNVTAKVLEPAKTFTLVAKDTGLSTATGTEGTGVELEVTLDALAPTGGLSMTVTHNIGSTTPSTLTVPVGKRRATLTVAIADNSDVSAAVVTHTVTLSASGWTPKRTGADTASPPPPKAGATTAASSDPTPSHRRIPTCTSGDPLAAAPGMPGSSVLDVVVLLQCGQLRQE